MNKLWDLYYLSSFSFLINGNEEVYHWLFGLSVEFYKSG